MNHSAVYRELSDEIVETGGFFVDYGSLMANKSQSKREEINHDSARRLLESASILACSDEDKHKALALSIAGTIMENEHANEVLKVSSDLILLRLGIFPSLEMAVHRHGDLLRLLREDGMESIPFQLYIEVLQRKLGNQSLIAGQKLYFLDFQIDVLRLLYDKRNISITAPTSAGKSFVLIRYVVDMLAKEDEYSVFYIVPTRALIAQIQKEFRDAFDEFDIGNTEIFTTSWQVVGEGKKEYSKGVFVLTQERLQAIQSKLPELSADLIIVDEAQGIEEGARGILLEESVQRLIDRSQKAQVVFISPFTVNPEKLGSVFDCGEVIPLGTNFSPVSQNIFDVETTGKKVKISMISQELKRVLKIDEFRPEDPIPKVIYQKKSMIVREIVKGGPTMVYCNGAAECRQTAGDIADGMASKAIDPYVYEVVRFLENHIHKQYYLIDYLKRGVGYHYGAMPSTVRKAMESLFSRRLIETICCTSTLLKGVNFPARNIVIHKPRTGRESMEPLSFWNLAGRAGRLRRDFVGNIYCLDIKSWPGYKPTTEREGHLLESSMENVITEKKELIISHLREYMKRRQGDSEVIEAAVTRFIINEIQRENEEFIGRLLKRDSAIRTEDLNQIVSSVKRIVDRIEIPGEIVIQNRSIDPRLQNELYLTLSSMDQPPIPLNPSHDDFYNSLIAILRITNEVFRKGRSDTFLIRLAVLTKQWVREWPLGWIIQSGLEYREKNLDRRLEPKEINDVIEGIIRNINYDITHEVCREVSCYLDVLLNLIGEHDLRNEVDDSLAYFIEIGASRPTTLTLLNNGIPRTAAILMARKMPMGIRDYDTVKKHTKMLYGELKKDIPSILLEEFLA